MKSFLLFVLILMAVVVVATPAAAQTVSGSIGTISRGSSGRGTIFISIPGGLHVNSNRPSSQYAIPTSVRLSGTGVRIGAVGYPRGHDRKFAFSESLINVYEGRVPITFKVTVPKNFRGDTAKIRAVVRYQACTEEVCYPPRTKEVTLNVRVR